MSRELLQSLRRDLESCMLIDRPRLGGRLRRVGQGKSHDNEMQRLRREVDASMKRRQERAANAPKPQYPAELPIVERREDIKRAISEHQVIVLCGETGSGKTTQLPKICLELGRGVAGMIGHTQPRRIAARSVAARIADELRSPLGKHVGYKIRFGDTVGESCSIKIMTDGILLAETRSDHSLLLYDTIIIDEAHERSLNIDFLLGYLKRLLPRRPDLKLIITSATIDPRKFSEHFNGAPILEVSGRAHPVEVRYRPLASDDPDEADRDLRQGVLDAVDEAVREVGGPGDILIFLSGEREIREMTKALGRHALAGNTEILPLYARLTTEEQNRVFAPHRGRRIVLSTNVAETSLTVPGIRYVIDAGTARISRYSARSGVQRLPIEPISRASADQRKGRCGRIGPGICIRLYSEEDHLAREEFTPPEILRTNLASVILQMKALKLGKVEEFPFVEPPRWGMITDGYNTLHELGAIDEWGEITPPGEALARLPIDPRLGRLLQQAREEGCVNEALVIAAALSIQDPRERPHDRRDAADEAHRVFQDERSDFVTLLTLWRFFQEHRGLGTSKLRKLCRENFISFVRMREWMDVHHQLRDLVAEAEVTIGARSRKREKSTSQHVNKSTEHGPGIQDSLYDSLHRSVLAGFLSRIGARRETHEYTGAHGRKFHIFPGSGVFKSAPQWVVAAELIETSRLYAHSVARISPAWVERLAPHLVKRRYAEPNYRERTADVGAMETVTLLGLEIVRNRRIAYGPIDPKASREIFIRGALVEGRYRTNALFFNHNRALIEEIRTIEEKSRRRGVLVDDERQFAFYDARIPEGIWSGASFEAWRKVAEEAEPRLLYMTREQLLADAEHGATLERFPEHLIVEGASLPLEYRFEPGHEDDGVTLTVPLALLRRLPRERLEWLVPGMIEEKIAALIRTLRKSLRRNFVPAPRFAAACAERMLAADRDAFGRGALVAAVERCLAGLAHSATTIEFESGSWVAASMPAHLRMNIKVIDDQGMTLAKGRDLDALLEQLAGIAGEPARSIADNRPRAKDRRIQAHDHAARPAEQPSGRVYRSWNFGEVAERVTVTRGGIELAAFPAIVDTGDGVSIRNLETPEAASEATRAGLRRLIMLRHPEEMTYQAQHLPDFDRMAVHFAGLKLGESSLLREQLLSDVVDRAFFDGIGEVRTKAAFEKAVDEGWHRLAEAVEASCALASAILDGRQQVELRLRDLRPPQFHEALGEITDQLANLMPGDFITSTPRCWLEQFPRYLKGIHLRIDKLTGGKRARDRQLAAEFNPLWSRCLERLDSVRRRGIVDTELLRFRWMLEELRISLFAQELGTVAKVSVQRLSAHWEALARM